MVPTASCGISGNAEFFVDLNKIKKKFLNLNKFIKQKVKLPHFGLDIKFFVAL